MNITNKDLKSRIIEISYKHKLSHLSSCLTAVDIIEEIYNQKGVDEVFVLSQGHAALALYVVLEKHLSKNAESLFVKHGVHPNRDLDDGIYCSSGSLGHGFPIALGMALADRSKNVYCVISDGESSEGSIWEALQIKSKFHVDNLKVYANINGFSAYDEIDTDSLILRLMCFDSNINLRPSYEYELPFLKGINAHYLVMDEAQYKQALELYI